MSREYRLAAAPPENRLCSRVPRNINSLGFIGHCGAALPFDLRGSALQSKPEPQHRKMGAGCGATLAVKPSFFLAYPS